MSGFRSSNQRIQGAVKINGTLTLAPTGETTSFGGGFDSSTGVNPAPTVSNINGRIITKLYVDLQGNDATATIGHIIGDGSTASAYIYKHVNSVNGVASLVQMVCIEDPAGAANDIDLFMKASDVAAGTQITATGDQQAIVTYGDTDGWELGIAKQTVAAGDYDGAYFYLTAGEGSASGAYSAGKFIITIIGHESF